jgi:hypothetical protein
MNRPRCVAVIAESTRVQEFVMKFATQSARHHQDFMTHFEAESWEGAE